MSTLFKEGSMFRHCIIVTSMASLSLASMSLGQPPLPPAPKHTDRTVNPPTIAMETMIVEGRGIIAALSDEPAAASVGSADSSDANSAIAPPARPAVDLPSPDRTRASPARAAPLQRAEPEPLPVPISSVRPPAKSFGQVPSALWKARANPTDATRSPRASVLSGEPSLARLIDGREPHTHVIAAPRIALLVGETGTIQLWHQVKLTYLEPAGEKMYRRVEFPPVGLGISMKLGAKDYDSAQGTMTLEPLAATMTAIDGRDKVPGLEFDVGKPRVTTRSLSLSLAAKAGEVYWIALPTAPDKEAVLLIRPTVLSEPQTTPPAQKTAAP